MRGATWTMDNETRLLEAEKAYHALMTGRGVVSVTDENGENVSYTRAKASDLKAYIRELKAAIAGTSISRPFRPMFF